MGGANPRLRTSRSASREAACLPSLSGCPAPLPLPPRSEITEGRQATGGVGCYSRCRAAMHGPGVGGTDYQWAGQQTHGIAARVSRLFWRSSDSAGWKGGGGGVWEWSGAGPGRGKNAPTGTRRGKDENRAPGREDWRGGGGQVRKSTRAFCCSLGSASGRVGERGKGLRVAKMPRGPDANCGRQKAGTSGSTAPAGHARAEHASPIRSRAGRESGAHLQGHALLHHSIKAAIAEAGRVA